ncbi:MULTISPECIES: alpha-hydroxy acid oxidase [Sphingobacterium]|jgi:L-lactate dehydrogenase (cytochrome)|uniref:Alpha-hydroxy-acid oxidizing enzyme n=2 Tax=Sphingobacterium multivorum TaxID=28454 RepID=A0A654DS63_SPHMU|nr:MULTISPECIES: alpha-hydroxy acid oxidase [Sphingobacterium]HAE66372.1 alpha-hydroxy-acid oxidizing protein [Sphingobacterium sp.]OFV16667.1 alpha-hydroxy-acid oxidizing enzyme [Sphingobacterium sp. HMSC13C05]QQT45689.1 alpha-hydroxy-acid oxidizing protein [Sphingobacterium multivorum]SUJ28113.1 (S)-mandelate dehydrogenase [Sphingobacterium multivorum]VXD05383.1 Alpha-hydroxy-acid oxidizing enzyme [Sphingobacterium multivorum]
MSQKFIYNTRYPSVEDLKIKAKKRIPKFAFDYLTGGANEELNLARNENDFDNILLKPQYLLASEEIDLSVELFGRRYSAPFGVSPIGLQGLMWPNAPEILAKAAAKNDVPYILSTVSTSSIERIAEVSDGKAWFQLYHPTENRLRDDIIRRLQAVECPVLVVLVDVPAFGLRYREIKSGLSMPPKMSIANILQTFACPTWGIETLRHGIPSFATLKPYMEKGLDLAQLGQFMNRTFTGKVDVEKIKAIRDLWKGPLVLKGIATDEDMQASIALGVDGVIVSNHGGRQLDASESSINSLIHLASNPEYKNKIKIMLDGGIRSGVDLARAHAVGSDFNFMGRPFMYGVGALGNEGGEHTINMFKTHLYQVMKQLSLSKIEDLPQRLQAVL